MPVSIHKTPIFILFALEVLILVTRCSSGTPSGPDNNDPQFYTAAGYIHQQADGNRVVYGTGALPDTEPVDIMLLGVPQWVAAVPYKEGSLWVVVLTDGAVNAYTVVNREVMPVDITPDNLTVLTIRGSFDSYRSFRRYSSYRIHLRRLFDGSFYR